MTVRGILEHGTRIHIHARVFDFDDTNSTVTSLADVAERSARLVRVLDETGVERGDVVATLCSNYRTHLEAVRAAICYTSKSAGNPKGVAYGQRRVFVHLSPAAGRGASGLGQDDRILIMRCPALGGSPGST